MVKQTWNWGKKGYFRLGMGPKIQPLEKCRKTPESANNYYGKCSKISNTLKLRTPEIIAENNF